MTSAHLTHASHPHFLPLSTPARFTTSDNLLLVPSNIINPNSHSRPKVHTLRQKVKLRLVLPACLQVLICEEGQCAADEDEGVDTHAEACGVGGGFRGRGGGCLGAGGCVAGLYQRRGLVGELEGLGYGSGFGGQGREVWWEGGWLVGIMWDWD